MKPTAIQIKQSAMLLEQIASMAIVIDQIFFHGATPGAGEDEFENQNCVVQHLVAQIGYLADLGTGKLDGTEIPTVNGGADVWLTRPDFHQEAELPS